MGANNSISQQSSLFKTYNPQEWSSSESLANGSQLWWNKRTNQHFEVYSIPKTSTIQDLQKYELRYLHSFYLVKVFDVLRINDSQAMSSPKKSFKNNNNGSIRTLLDNNENVVLVEHIVSRFSAIKWLTFEEALYSLKCIFKGCSLMHSFFGKFDIDQQMIGINQFGKVKIWLNADFAVNSIPNCKQLKRQDKASNSSYKKSQNDRKRINELVRKIFSLVENKVRTPFAEKLKEQVKGCQTFGQASQVVQVYAKQNKIYLSQYIAIRNRKNQFPSSEKPKNYSPYYNTNHTEKQSSTYNNKDSKLTINVNDSVWSNIRADKKTTLSFIEFGNKNRGQYHGRLDSMIEKKSDSLKKQQTDKSKGSVNEREKNIEKYSQKHVAGVNSPPRVRANLGGKLDFIIDNFIPSNTRFSLGSPRAQQLYTIAELKKEKQLEDQINRIKEEDRRKTQQYEHPTKRQQNRFKGEYEEKSRKYPPRYNAPTNKKCLELQKNLSKGENTLKNGQDGMLMSMPIPETVNYEVQEQQKPFKKKNNGFPVSNENLDFQKKNYTECVSIYSNDPSKISTSLETRFPINSPKKSETDVFYFKSYKQDKHEKIDKQVSFNNQIKEVHFQQEAQGSDLSPKTKKIIRTEQKNSKQSEKFETYLANRRKSNRIGKGLLNKNFANENTFQENLTGLSQERISMLEQQKSISHTLMEKLNPFDDLQFEQFEQYQANLLDAEQFEYPQQSAQNDYIYQVQNTVESSVDQMDDPEDLKAKLIHIKVKDLFQQRQRRQNQQKRRSLQKDKEQKNHGNTVGAKQSGSFKVAKAKKFQLDMQMDPFYNKQKNKITKVQGQAKVGYEDRKPKDNQRSHSRQIRSKYQTSPPLANKYFKEGVRNPEVPNIQTEFKKTEKIMRTQQAKRCKQTHDTIYNYTSLKHPANDPYDIEAKYNKYVTNKPSVDKEKQRRAVIGQTNHNRQAFQNGLKIQKTQKKQKKGTVPQEVKSQYLDSLKDTKKKPRITYQKMKNFLYE